MHVTLNTDLKNSWGRWGTGRCLSQLICYDEFIAAGTPLLFFLSASSPPAEWWVLLWKTDFFSSCSQGSQSHSPAVLGILPGKSKTSRGRSCGLQYNRPQGTHRRELELRVWIQSPRFNSHKRLDHEARTLPAFPSVGRNEVTPA